MRKQLIEELIITPEQLKEYDNLKTDDEKIDFITAILRSAKIKNNIVKYYTMKPKADLQGLLNSIYEHGFDTDSNSYLKFIVNAENKIFPTENQAKLIKNALNNDFIDADKDDYTIDSLYNKDAYNGSDFKLKSLIFLSNEKLSKRYGDVKTLKELKNKILAAKDDLEIENLINNWQSKTPDNKQTDKTGSDILTAIFKEDNKKLSKETLDEYITKIIIDNNIYTKSEWETLKENLYKSKAYLKYISSLLKQSFESDIDGISSEEMLIEDIIESIPELVKKLNKDSDKNTGLEILTAIFKEDNKKFNKESLNDYVDNLVKDIKGFKDYGWSYLKDSVLSDPAWIKERNKILTNKYNNIFEDEKLIDIVNDELISAVSKILEKKSDGK